MQVTAELLAPTPPAQDVGALASAPRPGARNESREEAIARLRTIVYKTLDSLIPAGAPCALVDFPHYPNVGDSAIYLGELAYLRNRGCAVHYVADWQTYDRNALRRALPEGIVLINGGGNFGDLYPRHQQIRQAVLRDFPDRRVVQLPQSVHFDDPAALEASRADFSAHPDFHLVVRDQVSLDLVQRSYDTPTYLCPDMAFLLDVPRFKPADAPLAAVVLSRTDGEKAAPEHGGLAVGDCVSVADWLEEPPPGAEWLYRWGTVRGRWQRTHWPRSVISWAQRTGARRMADQRLARGLRQIHGGRTLVTDRLHALILGWMSGMPVFHVDNRYRKLGNLLDTWLPGRSDLPAFARLDEALLAATVA
ncbi:polysaccharide pyruvyl transferase family protein [Azohydromonas sediminis]|uniref:polysaccharide pyruvyl transferase family protein n=1 Tax=Azohydromonas sediminis TaxID=2259674 RepID=UPI000E65690F|nr:polysaccharide pyruvyl transferase family protein [Azohydromonas sediminis]